MSLNRKKHLSSNLYCIAGVTVSSILLSFPALALVKSETSAQVGHNENLFQSDHNFVSQSGSENEQLLSRSDKGRSGDSGSDSDNNGGDTNDNGNSNNSGSRDGSNGNNSSSRGGDSGEAFGTRSDPNYGGGGAPYLRREDDNSDR